ncbi:MAG: 50S ribosomal protein L19e [Candidatus Bathyarchaeota archaeon]|jgi:large subunit ribosomal protein L19e|nr:50S ribosomal protein L19e [Candidatus Bathyarchaeota archaeon A05DMB-5]MDH7557648.1 50S ribosomal protein L19e [Candidatus Bathyarchaeota archaeon]
MSLKSQRRLAAQILKIGQNRVWIDPERIDDVEAAITREEIRKLVHEGVIQPLPEKGVSRARARVLHEKKKKGRRRGPGSTTGSAYAKISRKEAWMNKIRALRKRLRELKEKKIITEDTYRKLYRMASSGRFESAAELERYLKAQELWRKR